MSAVHFIFDAIGTKWHIDLNQEISSDQERIILEKIQRRIEEFDRHYSRFRSDSLVMEMAKIGGKFELPDDAQPMLELYRQIYDLTDGLFTPLIGQVMVDAGYDANYSLEQNTPLQEPLPWDAVLSFDTKSATLNHPALLDFGAAGKGYLIDLISDLLKEHDVPNHTIDAGGDILHLSTSDIKLKVGLENPANLKQVLGIATLANASICGSAGNRREWGQFHHIIDPKKLKSPRQILATWVVATSTMVADALATALYFKPAAVLAQTFDFEYVILRSDFTAEKSASFPGELFTI